MTSGAPRLASALMRLLLPADAHEAIAGDVNEDWSAVRSRTRYWRLTCGSIAAFWWDSLRHPRQWHDAFDSSSTAQGDSTMQSLLQDIRYGGRLMRHAPGFTLAAVVTLALGIGANTGIFSIVNVLTLKPLAYGDPHRVAFVLGWDAEHQSLGSNLNVADLADLTREARNLEDVAGYAYWSANFTGGDLPERVQAYRVTANTFSLLDVRPLVGR
jgi:hypothetical protein